MANQMNRRAFLRTAASASAITVGTSAVTVAAEHPDAKLLAMAPELDRLYAEHLVAEAEYAEAYKAVAAIIGERPPMHAPHWPQWRDADRAERVRSGVRDLAQKSDALYNAASDTAVLILSIPATTIEGLAAKAKALKFDLGMVGNGDPRDEWDVDKDRAFDFLCEIERLGPVERA